jgi:hypothetical protein
VQPKPENNVQLDKIRKTQAELHEVTKLMEENIMATQQRGEMMDHLQVKTGEWYGNGMVQTGFQTSSTISVRVQVQSLVQIQASVLVLYEHIPNCTCTLSVIAIYCLGGQPHTTFWKGQMRRCADTPLCEAPAYPIR